MALFTFINVTGALVGLAVAAPFVLIYGIFKFISWLQFEKWWRNL